MKILVTGSNGYIAKSLIKELSEYNITILNRKILDLSDYAAMHNWFKDKYFDVVIHCAAVGGSRLLADTTDITSENLKMYYNLLSFKDNFNKFISFGSGAELFAKNTPYGMSKSIIAESINRTENFYNIRIFGVFDHNELDTRFIKSNIQRYIKNEPMIVHCDKIMDFFYMQDLIMLVKYYILGNNLPKVVNCSYQSKYSLKTIADFINTLDTHKVPVILENSAELQFYCGVQCPLNLNYHGIHNGILNTFRYLNDNT